ncbi:MAG: zinc-ribbon domain-containing protein [Promethearchaeota archaeon]
MQRRGGRGRRRNQGPWPGNGPFSHLPPWERPGWKYGPGSCWTLYQRGQIQPPPQEAESEFPPAQLEPRVSHFCVHCGTALAVDANFCSQCGEPVKRIR